MALHKGNIQPEQFDTIMATFTEGTQGVVATMVAMATTAPRSRDAGRARPTEAVDEALLAPIDQFLAEQAKDPRRNRIRSSTSATIRRRKLPRARRGSCCVLTTRWPGSPRARRRRFGRRLAVALHPSGRLQGTSFLACRGAGAGRRRWQPACPIVLPSGASNPATYPTTGFVTCSAMYAAARSSASPPISPIITISLVSGSSSKASDARRCGWCRSSGHRRCAGSRWRSQGRAARTSSGRSRCPTSTPARRGRAAG